MKKMLILIILLGLLQALSAQNKFELHGQLKGQDKGMIYLYYPNDQNKGVRDSAVILNGKFYFSGKINGPTMASLTLKENKRNENNSIRFFIEPADMAVVLPFNRFSDATFTGSKIQAEYAELQGKKQKVQDRWKVVMDTLTEVNKKSNVEYQKLRDWVLLPYFEEMKDLDYTFFSNHPQSYVTADMLRFHVADLTLDSLQMFYNKLGKRLQQTNNGKDLANEIKKLRGGSPGSIAKDFTTTDINGNKLSLSDLKGKFVLLDFWASWCVPCRASNPHLKELYAKYKNKGFEIIGVSDDDSKPEAWKNAVEKDGLPWRHVLRGFDRQKLMKNEMNEKDISEKYGIHSLPTKILIDSQGKIIGRYSEEEVSLDEELKKIFRE